MRVLHVNAFADSDRGRVLPDAADRVLEAGSHDLRRIDLVDSGFEPFMSTAERRAYHSDAPLLADETRRSAEHLLWAEAALFSYPTQSFTVPARLKGWLERVMVYGVAFTFDAKGRIKPNLTHIRRLGGITVLPAGRLATLRARDSGRRTIMRGLRLNTSRRCRGTWVAQSRPDPVAVERALRRW